MTPRVSLVMATLGRGREIGLFLESLISQTYRDFELIIVDQNGDDRVAEACAPYREQMALKVIKSSVTGLSVNRNIGLGHISGSVVGFPDDDCEYEAHTLENAAGFFTENPEYDFYTCNTRDKHAGGAILNAPSGDADISLYNFTKTGISFTIFVRKEAFSTFRFDERLGVGAEFGSGEESDLLLFLLENGRRGRYHAGDFVFHPAKPETPEKAYYYGLGFGALYKKAVFHYGFLSLLPVFLVRILKGIINCIIRGNKRMRAASLKGRTRGFIAYHTGKTAE